MTSPLTWVLKSLFSTSYEVEKKTAARDVQAKLEESSDGVIVKLPPTDDTDSSASASYMGP